MKKLLFICSFLGAFVAAKANNIIIDNGKIKGQSILSLNSTSNTVDIQFDLRWNNSFRTGGSIITGITLPGDTTARHTTAPAVYIGTSGATVYSTNTSYVLGQMIVISANTGTNKVYIITTAGTSGTVAPSAITTGANSVTFTGGNAKARYVGTVTSLNGSGLPTSGAAAYSVVSSGIIKGIIVTNGGSGYASTSPTITFGFKTNPLDERIMSYSVQKSDFYDAAWVFMKFRVAQDYVSQPGASNTGSTITVHSTQGLRKGMPVKVTSGTGSFDDTTIVTAVVDAQTFTVNRAPTSSLGSNTIITGTRMWEHGYLTSTGHTIGSPNTWATGSKMRVGLSDETKSLSNIYDASAPFNFNPAVGLFYYPGPAASGTGDYSLSGASLRWNYAAHGLNDNQMVDIMVYGVEMVQIPSGSYYLGDGATDNAQFGSSTTAFPYLVASEAATGTLGGGSSPLIKTFSGGATQTTGDDFNNTTATQTLPDLYPKGVSGFFVMKYEMGQRQYKEFFNTLSPLQKTFHDISSADGKGSDNLVARNAFSWNSSNPTSDAILLGDAYGDVACNYLSWSDGTAYADWAGLRPMSEFEYEKAARGTNYSMANEYAWGSTSYVSASGVSNGGQKNEAVTTANANANYGNVFGGPLRVGVFATASTTTKEAASSSFFGVMDLSGNLWERVVSVGNANGRTFRKIHGDGNLDEYGSNNVPYTPNTTASGSGFRGGSYSSTDPKRMRTSDRNRAAEIQAGRFSDWGFRCVRNIPLSNEL